MENKMIEIGQRICQSRKRLKLNQQALAELIGCEKATISKYENGKSDPHTTDLIKIADFLRVDIGWLLTGEAQADNLGNGTVSETEPGWNGNVLTGDDREMLDLYRKLPPEKREVLKLLVNQMLPKEKKEV